MRFIVVIEPDDEAGGSNVSAPALPGCFTQGDTVDESLDRACDAIAVYLDGESRESLRAAGIDPRIMIEAVEFDVAIPA